MGITQRAQPPLPSFPSQSGTSAQFEQMQTQFLGPLWERLAGLGSGDAVLIAVPGNHDLYRPDPNGGPGRGRCTLAPRSFRRDRRILLGQPTGDYRQVVHQAFGAWRLALGPPGPRAAITPSAPSHSSPNWAPGTWPRPPWPSAWAEP
jgi:hypothetical protein